MSKSTLGLAALYCSAQTVTMGKRANAPEMASTVVSPLAAGASAAGVSPVAAGAVGAQAASMAARERPTRPIEKRLRHEVREGIAIVVCILFSFFSYDSAMGDGAIRS